MKVLNLGRGVDWPLRYHNSVIAKMLNDIRIIGWGNLDREDDGAGILVARRLVQLGVPALSCTGEALALVDAWKGASDVIIVDAVVTGAPLGTIRLWNIESTDLPSPLSANSHGFGLAEALTLASTLGQLPARLRFFGIEAAKFGFGSDVSPEVVAAVERAARQIAAEFKHLL